MLTLNRSLHETESTGRKEAPVTILQIGEGNFLRGFADWMIHECRKKGLYEGGIAITQPRPTGRAKIEKLASQNGLYTLVTQGIENGEPVMRREVIDVFSEVFDPYEDWQRFKRIAVSPDLQLVISNTTEAGLTYRPEELGEGAILSFPGKIAYLLHLRHEAFQGATDKGLVFLPCELLERNGDSLRDAVLRYADDWGYSDSFKHWVLENNRFLNSLVDRIVTGYPAEEQAESWFAEWGYRDSMLCTAEPYHLWAIEADEEMEKLLPLRKAGLNVFWTNDLKPFQQRKVRILNGAHTWMATLGLVNGVLHVGDLLEHSKLGSSVRDAVSRHILPALPYPEEELRAYAGDVFERFANPHIRHRLADIAMNALSKFKVRLLPTIAYYAERGDDIPELLALGFAGLLRYYKVKREADGSYVGRTLDGEAYSVRDDETKLAFIARHWERAGAANAEPISVATSLLAERELWGEDLSTWSNLAEAVAKQLTELERGVYQ
ncbi:tagaturonate reductase [Paenibacillus soyae]|uniref:Tagaturonate reductase n=1 Tax=Paenibacillus soyae TaxID=2969249 RepID=A0A9X2MPI1_9BACL|nr:tagaturonate reductase [Paenibacillus soyae]MCR2803852.1 tagaturonate reductase [Paenibacillus soyae]